MYQSEESISGKYADHAAKKDSATYLEFMSIINFRRVNFLLVIFIPIGMDFAAFSDKQICCLNKLPWQQFLDS